MHIIRHGNLKLFGFLHFLLKQNIISAKHNLRTVSRGYCKTILTSKHFVGYFSVILIKEKKTCILATTLNRKCVKRDRKLAGKSIVKVGLMTKDVNLYFCSVGRSFNTSCYNYLNGVARNFFDLFG